MKFPVLSIGLLALSGGQDTNESGGHFTPRSVGHPRIGWQFLWRYISFKDLDVKDDIECFVSVKLRDSRILSRKSPEVKVQLLKAPIDGSQGMMLWVSLMISKLEASH